MSTIITPASTQGDGYLVPAMPSVALNVVKSDVDVFDKGIHTYIGTGGDVVVIPENTAISATFKNFPSGLVLPVKVKAILSTGTTTADFVGIE